MTGQRGSATLWVLVMCGMALVVASLAVDLWEVGSVRRRAAGLADSAAAAGATAVDEVAYRADPSAAPLLDPTAAVDRACAALAQSGVRCGSDAVVVADASSVRVHVRTRVDFALLRLVGAAPFDVTAVAAARPFRND